METQILHVDPANPDPSAIAHAAELLRRGELVAFPTETVYGLGANALESTAVGRIFEAKGRPAENPLIVHVLDSVAVRGVVAEWPVSAQRLADRFWPGPLTLVLPKSERIPPFVTAGGPTVAVRAPAHPVARALLRSAGIPLAAPSANSSNRLSPTTAEHVFKSLSGRIPLVVDGGPCPGGVESTVLDLTGDLPAILRPGPITLAELEPIVPGVGYSATRATGLRSPGLMPRHYAPNASLEVASAEAAERVETLLLEGKRVGWLAFAGQITLSNPSLSLVEMPADARKYASRLYASLHQLDEAGVDVIVVSKPPMEDEWRAVHDRLTRAACREPHAI